MERPHDNLWLNIFIIVFNSYIFLEGDAGKNMVLEGKVKAEIQLLLSHIKSHITGIARVGYLSIHNRLLNTTQPSGTSSSLA